MAGPWKDRKEDRREEAEINYMQELAIVQPLVRYFTYILSARSKNRELILASPVGY
jgi:hypothetical protein